MANAPKVQKFQVLSFKFHDRRGFTLIDVLISLGILVVLFGGIYLVYFSILDVIANLEFRAAATSVLNQEVEVIRNMKYEDVGTLGGVPAGLISQTKMVSFGSLSFSIKTVVRNIDDPFDGVLGGNPNDTAPSDYKLVEMEIDCVSCNKFVPLIFTTTVAPKNLEGASEDGSIFINVFDANGLGVSEAQVRVINQSVTPTIDLTDETNANGVLQLVGVPTSTQGYQIEVLKAGYSTERTYTPGDLSNPNPSKPHATVAARTVTSISFAIDKVSVINLISSGFRCEAIPSVPFSLQGNKIIGTLPDIYKFSTTTITDAQGLKTLNNLEWDTYSILMTDDDFDIYGMGPFVPLTVNPSSTIDLRFSLLPADPPSLLVSVKDLGTGAGVPNATVSISNTGFATSTMTGRAFYSDSDWSAGNYSSLSGAINVDGFPGSIRLAVNASGTYDTFQTSWLESEAIDFGSASTSFYEVSWSPEDQPVATGAGSMKLQVAANNDNTAWNFVGPDGGVDTYYTVSGADLWSGHAGKRYLKYRVYLMTEDENETPSINHVSIKFSGVCVPPAQTVFQNLPLGTYDLTVDAAGFSQGTSSVPVAGDWQQVEILLGQ